MEIKKNKFKLKKRGRKKKNNKPSEWEAVSWWDRIARNKDGAYLAGAHHHQRERSLPLF